MSADRRTGSASMEGKRAEDQGHRTRLRGIARMMQYLTGAVSPVELTPEKSLVPADGC